MAAALPWALPVLRVPAGAPQLAVRWAIWRLARLLGRGQPGATRWAWRRLRAAHGPEQTLARLRFNASVACRGLTWKDMGEITQEAMEDAMRGHAMERTQVYAKIPRSDYPRT